MSSHGSENAQLQRQIATRSQTKRRRDEESSEEHPRKRTRSSRSGPVDYAKNGAGHRIISARPGAKFDVPVTVPEHTSKDQDHSNATRKGKESTGTDSGQANGSLHQNEGRTSNANETEHADVSGIDADEFAQQKRDLLKQFVVLVEFNRSLECCTEVKHLDHDGLDHLAKTVNLAASAGIERGMASDPTLAKLPASWSGWINELGGSLQDVLELREDLHKSRECLRQTQTALQNAAIERSMMIYNQDAESTLTAKKLNQDVNDLRIKLIADTEHHSKVEANLTVLEQGCLADGKRVIDAAEEVLTGLHLIPPRSKPTEGDYNGTAFGHESQNGQEAKIPGSNGDENDEHEHHEQATHKGKVPLLIDQFRQTKREHWKNAARAREHITVDRERARNNYGQDLRRFLHAQEDGYLHGTKTDFDKTYYMEQCRLLQEQAQAEEYAKEQRKLVRDIGAMHRSEIVSNFGTWSDDGYLHEGEELAEKIKEDIKWQITEEAIVKWLENEDLKAINKDSEWEIKEDRLDPGSKAIMAFPEDVIPPHPFDDLAEGRERRYIDKLEVLRSRKFRPDYLAAKALEEKAWYQVWDGI